MFGTCCCFCNRYAGGRDDCEDEEDQRVEISDGNNRRLISKSRKEGSSIPVGRSRGVQTWGLKRHPDGDKPMLWSFYAKRWDGRMLYINYDERTNRIVTSTWRPNLCRYFTIHPSLEEGRFLIKLSEQEKYLSSNDGKLYIRDSCGDGSNMAWQLQFGEKWINTEIHNPISIRPDSAINVWIYQAFNGTRCRFYSPVPTLPCISYSTRADDREIFLETGSDQFDTSFVWKATAERPAIPTILETITAASGDDRGGKRYLKILQTTGSPGRLVLTAHGKDIDAQQWNPAVAQFS